MKLIRKRGDTSSIFQVFIQDSSSATGAGLAGLAFNSGGLTAYFHRDVDTTATAITLATMTVGTFTSSGFKEIDAANMPGWYQFCPPDAALAATSTPHSVGFHLKGATNMAPLALEVQLIAADIEDTVRLGLTALPNAAAGVSGGLPTIDAALNVSTFAVESGTAQAGAAATVTLRAGASATDALYNGSVITIYSGTGAGQSRVIAGYVGATKVATVGRNWATNPDNTSVYKIHGLSVPRVDDNLAVILQTGTGTGQLDFTSGIVKANLTQILGTLLTETAGQIAAGFKKVFDVAAPVFTATSVNQTGDNFNRIGAPVGASISADVAAVKAALPAALTGGGNIKADIFAINTDATSAANVAKTTRAICRGTVGAASTTTSIVTSAFVPAGAAADQFKGRIVTFDADTTTTALRGQATDITASSNAATPTLTVTALTTAPISGDTFSIT